MKYDITTGTWQDDTGCPISIVLAATSDVSHSEKGCWGHVPNCSACASAPFTKADPASHKRARTRGRISPTFTSTRKVGLLWTCVHSFCLSRQPSAHVARKDPTSPLLLATRNLRTAIKRVRSDLVLEESQSPEKSSYWEKPQPLQKAWGRVHVAQYSPLPSFRERRNGKIRFPRR